MAHASSSETSEQSSKISTKSGNGKVKPSYKHIPHSQKPPHLVAKRNARERRRVQAVNQAFYKLRKCVPIENRNKRVSKVKTLQRAIDYIRKLEQTLAEDDEANGASNNQYGSVSQVAAGSSSSSSHLPQQSQVNVAANQKKGRKSTICDQIQPIVSHSDNNHQHQQQPQIIKQKRGRKAALSHEPTISKPAQVNTTNVLPARADQLSSICQVESNLPNYTGHSIQEHTAVSSQPSSLIDTHKFPLEAYYCPPAYQPQPQHQQQQQSTQNQSSDVLRESSAYNNSLNYYNEHHQHQQYSNYLTGPISTERNLMPSSGQQYDMYTSSYTSGSFYTPTQLGNYTTYASAEISNSSTAAYLAPATPDTLSGWQPRISSSNSSDSTTLASASKSETLSLNDSVSSSISTTNTMLSTALNSSTSTAGPESSTRATSLALLQSPTSSTSSSSSSASSAASANSSAATSSSSTTANSDNSSTVVFRSRNSPTNINRQQVNNYLAYASNRMEARAAHLSFAANNNDNNNNNNNNGYNHRQQQQQLNERKSITATSNSDELGLSSGRGGSDHHQVRHLLNAANANSVHRNRVSLSSANNLHDQHRQQYHQQNHHNHNHNHHLQQQSLYHNNQHPNPNHLSALQSMASISASSSSSNLNSNLLIHQQTIQEYTSLPS